MIAALLRPLARLLSGVPDWVDCRLAAMCDLGGEDQ